MCTKVSNHPGFIDFTVRGFFPGFKEKGQLFLCPDCPGIFAQKSGFKNNIHKSNDRPRYPTTRMAGTERKYLRGSLLLQLTVISLWMQSAMPMQEEQKSNLFHADGAVEETVPTQQNRFDANQENTGLDDDSIETTDFLNLPPNGTTTCFPYFISQDIEALLLQASRMLSKTHDERQQSWLQLFVRRLQSLSSQLRHLPVKHRSRCFQSRQMQLNSTSPEPEPDVQLHNAKSLFVKLPELNRPQHKEFITGKVTDTARFKPERHYENALTYKRNHVNQHSARAGVHMNGIDPSMNLYVPQFMSKTETRAESGLPQRQEALEYPIAYKMKDTIDYETMPFLPRSSRRNIPRQIEEKMRFHMQQEQTQVSSTSTTMTAAEAIPDSQAENLKPNPPKGFGVPKLQATSTPSKSEIFGHSAVFTENFEKSTTDGNSEHELSENIGSNLAANVLQTDTLVQQLHSNIHRPEKLTVIHRTPVTQETIEMATDAMNFPSVQDVNIRTDAILDNTMEHSDNDHRELQNFNEVNNNNNNNNDNGMVFDREQPELGASVGEIYEEDALPKDISTPLSVKQPNLEKGDEVVRQLMELKSAERQLPRPTKEYGPQPMKKDQSADNPK